MLAAPKEHTEIMYDQQEQADMSEIDRELRENMISIKNNYRRGYGYSTPIEDYDDSQKKSNVFNAY